MARGLIYKSKKGLIHFDGGNLPSLLAILVDSFHYYRVTVPVSQNVMFYLFEVDSGLFVQSVTKLCD